MARSIRRLGLAGVALAFVLIAGLNFSALERQWNVPYLGIQEANAWNSCVDGRCRIDLPIPGFGGTLPVFVPGCWRVGIEVTNPCSLQCVWC